jgi:hypothetical protein
MSDLDKKEQDHVRAALRFLQRRLGTWAPVAKAVNISPTNLVKVVRGDKCVSLGVAFRTARVLGVMVDDLLVGKFVPPGACPNCGHVLTSDFKDENTVAEEAPRPNGSGLALVK